MRIGKVLLAVVMTSFVLFSCLTLASLRMTYQALEKEYYCTASGAAGKNRPL